MSQDNYILNDIPDYEGLYAATRDGRIWSYPKKWVDTGGRNHNGLWMKAKKEHHGYYTVSLRGRNGRRKTHYVHRLVACLYIPNLSNLSQVNHKNGSKADNRVENLEWMTLQNNIKHAIKNNLRGSTLGEKNGSSKLTLMQVINIRHCHGSISSSKLAEYYKVGPSTIQYIWRGLRWGNALKLASPKP